MKRLFLCLAILLSYFTTVSSQNEIYKKISNLKQDLVLLKAYPYGFEDIDTEDFGLDSSIVKNYSIDNFDIDSLTSVIVNEVTTYLKKEAFENIDWTDFPGNIDIKSDTSETFHVLDFGYGSGGSAGYIPQSIVIREIADSLQIYDLRNTESLFVEFYPLYDNTYLCISETKGGGWCPFQSVYVIDFTTNIAKSLTVFGQLNSLRICWGEVSFDPSKKYLSINFDGEIQAYDYNDCQSYFNKDTGNCFLITNCFTDGAGNLQRATLTTKFDGSKFVKP